MNLLHIDSSILAAGSVSRILSAEIVGKLRAQHPDIEVVYRDLADGAIGHLTGAHLAAGQGAVPEAPAVRADLAAGQAALAEFLAADVVVIGAPMYNFGISSQLKAWFDRLAVAGQTFKYTEAGPQGLAGGKKVIVASSRGGKYEGQPIAFLDHQESYIKTILGFFGITDITFVRAEGIAMGPEARAAAIEQGRADIARLAA